MCPCVIWHGSGVPRAVPRSEEHTSELQSQSNLVCRLLLEKKTSHRIAPSERVSCAMGDKTLPLCIATLLRVHVFPPLRRVREGQTTTDLIEHHSDSRFW